MLKLTKRAADKSAFGEDEPKNKITLNEINKSERLFDGRQKFNCKTTETGENIRKSTSKKVYGNDKKCVAKGRFQNKLNGSVCKVGTEGKKDWDKFKKERKELKLKRKMSKHSYDVTQEAKQIYEKLKCRRTEEKSHLVQKLFDIFSNGNTIPKIVMAHDTTRILQCMLKYASPEIRDQISEKLLPYTVGMCQSKYSHFCVVRMINYGSPNIKNELVNNIFGHIVKLACHNISSKILDQIYLNVANVQQKSYMRQEFYGELYRNTKDENVKSLADTYKDSTNMKSSIMGAVKSNLERVANKKLVDSALVHAIMIEYLQACEDDKIEEIAMAITSLMPLMLTTKDGSQAAIICFYKSTTKNRRAIIKNIKQHLVKIATHEDGHVFLVAVLNTLDDTKATKKAIYDHLHGELKTLVSNQYGRHVVQWLVTPANTSCFHPTFINTIEEGLQYSKKDKEARRKEIFEQIEEPIAQAIVQDPSFWLSGSHIGLVTADILKKLTKDHFFKATEALVTVITQSNWLISVEEKTPTTDKRIQKKMPDMEAIIETATKRKKQYNPSPFIDTKQKEGNSVDDDDKVDSLQENENKNTVSGIEDAGIHIVLKKIIKNDGERAKDGPTFGGILLEKLTKDTLKYWLTINRACFVLLNIVEQNEEAVSNKLKNLLSDIELFPLLKQQQSKGAQLLAEKLL